MKEEKVAMTIELGASRSDKELIQALHRRLSMEEDQRLDLAKTIREVSQTIISLV
jgi:IS5 family transposase